MYCLKSLQNCSQFSLRRCKFHYSSSSFSFTKSKSLSIAAIHQNSETLGGFKPLGVRVVLNVCSTEDLKLHWGAYGAEALWLFIYSSTWCLAAVFVLLPGSVGFLAHLAPLLVLSLSRRWNLSWRAADLWLLATIHSVTPLTCMHTACVCLCMSKSKGRFWQRFQSKWQHTINESLGIGREDDALVLSPLVVRCAEDCVAFLLCNRAPFVTAQTRHCWAPDWRSKGVGRRPGGFPVPHLKLCEVSGED